MNNKYQTYEIFDSPVGELLVETDGTSIVQLKSERKANPGGKKEISLMTTRAAVQLREYFNGKRKNFDLPLKPNGTNFQRQVWDALMEIPYGETGSYKQIAQAIDNPDAYRAVGNANNRNPIWIMIPCHRVIGADGTLTGYGGGLEMKQILLNIEKGNKRESI